MSLQEPLNSLFSWGDLCNKESLMVIRGCACVWGRSGSSSPSESGSNVLSWEARLKLQATAALSRSRLTKESCRGEGSTVVVVVVVVGLAPDGPACGSLVGGNGIVIGSVGNCLWT